MLPVWKNLGFILYVVLYFTQTNSIWKWPEESLTSVVFKLLPIFHIILIVVSTMSESTEQKSSSAKSYQRTIMAGLLASSLGDFALVYRESSFLVGLALFATAQSLYIKAFGFKPFGSGPFAATFAVVAGSFFAYLYSGMQNEDLVVRFGAAVYALLIFTMAWRATARFMHRQSLPRFFAVIGALSFVSSDFMLALEKWRGGFDRAPMWVMITYYTAQLLIGLSACDDDDFNDDDDECAVKKVKSSNGATSRANKVK